MAKKLLAGGDSSLTAMAMKTASNSFGAVGMFNFIPYFEIFLIEPGMDFCLFNQGWIYTLLFTHGWILYIFAFYPGIDFINIFSPRDGWHDVGCWFMERYVCSRKLCVVIIKSLNKWPVKLYHFYGFQTQCTLHIVNM